MTENGKQGGGIKGSSLAGGPKRTARSCCTEATAGSSCTEAGSRSRFRPPSGSGSAKG